MLMLLIYCPASRILFLNAASAIKITCDHLIVCLMQINIVLFRLTNQCVINH